MSKPKIAWVSHSPALLPVGQSKVTREFCKRLYNDYDLTVVGLDHCEVEGMTFPYPIIGVPSGRDDLLVQVLQKLNPVAIVFSHDIWRFFCIAYPEGNQQGLKQLLPNTKFIGYFTIDGDPFHEAWFPILRCCEVLVTPSDYGKKVIQENYAQAPVAVVPFGVDITLFKPEDDKEQYKKSIDVDTEKLYKETGVFPILLGGKFVCCFIGMNQNKKNIGAIVDNFAEFSKDKPDVFLVMVLHSSSRPQRSYVQKLDTDVQRIVKQTGLHDKCYIMEKSLPEESLVRIYKFSDCLLYPSVGEGFGLQLLESMACKCIPIVTDYTSLPELVGEGRGLKIKVGAFVRGPWDVRRAVVDEEDMISKMEYLYALWKFNKDLLKGYQERGYEWAKTMTWDTSYAKMKQVIDASLLNMDFVDTELEAV